ncbi:Gfo/Idh/MocA family oxidoreductase [Salinarchaeum sp. IM2453]|uniref:Gfo/Idh/MocA family protein n=1 Tax=Salinarchaeum sp. IM2453 TaxID=2862870 RepID=UPI001C83B478|nr:Gfo/Idh/MocA family oxidoreductase [Salinarchaeum sp. IM2453]QZA89086.1 Gfo/Idh/MocA family oxidoreductase [Salinarchaeum sp. IM2453]
MKVLVVGLGSIGHRHARLLKNIDKHIDVIALRQECTGNSLGIQEYSSFKKAFKKDIDAAVIANPTHKHVKTAIKCAKNDCHLLIEKPLSHSLEGVDTLINIVSDRELITLMGCQLRYDPILEKIREMIKETALGEIVSYRAETGSYLPDWRPDQDYRSSYSADPQMGGGVVLDLIHELDYTYWLLKELKITASEISYVDMLDINSEAVAEMIFRSHNGPIGSIHLDYCRRKPKREIEVICEQGTIIGDLKNKELTVERHNSVERESFDYGRDVRFRNQLDYFWDCIQEGKQTHNDVQEGKRILELALQARRKN